MGIMKRVRMMAFAAVLVAARARAQPSALGCAAEGDHERWALKTRSKPRSLTSAKAVSPPTILAWAIPAGHGAGETAARRPREPRLYTVSAFVRKIKLSDDDCDLHLELAGSGAPGAPRVIVEIPAAQAAWQKKASGMFNLSKDVQSHVYNDDKAKRSRSPAMRSSTSRINAPTSPLPAASMAESGCGRCGRFTRC
jgi:hypothetical protein